MNKLDSDLDRLLRAARHSPGEDPAAEIPFGFDTRVVAIWRGRGERGLGEYRELARLLRRVAVGAMMLAVCAGAGALWQFQQNDELDEPGANAYAMADSVIEAGEWQ